MGPLAWIKKKWHEQKRYKSNLILSNKDNDSLKIILPGLYMSMNRPANLQYPHEVSMFVPRAELRKSIEEEGKKTTWEVLLNSITIVHAPLHEPLGGSPSAGSKQTKD